MHDAIYPLLAQNVCCTRSLTCSMCMVPCFHVIFELQGNCNPSCLTHSPSSTATTNTTVAGLGATSRARNEAAGRCSAGAARGIGALVPIATCAILAAGAAAACAASSSYDCIGVVAWGGGTHGRHPAAAAAAAAVAAAGCGCSRAGATSSTTGGLSTCTVSPKQARARVVAG